MLLSHLLIYLDDAYDPCPDDFLRNSDGICCHKNCISCDSTTWLCTECGLTDDGDLTYKVAFTKDGPFGEGCHTCLLPNTKPDHRILFEIYVNNYVCLLGVTGK